MFIRFSCLPLKSKSQTAMRQTLSGLSNLVLQFEKVGQMDDSIMFLYFSKPSDCVNFFQGCDLIG